MTALPPDRILRVIMSERAAHEAARELVVGALRAGGRPVEETGESGLLLVEAGAGRALVRVLVRNAPHPRGRSGNLGLHWMLSDQRADFVALVDLSRRRAWLLPVDEFRRRAQMLRGPRFHLDWLVARLGPTRSRIADEAEFDTYALEVAVQRYLAPAAPAGYEVNVTLEGVWRRALDAGALAALAALARRVLSAEGVAAPAAVGIAVTSDRRVRDLNRLHLGLDEPTDVLSFPLAATAGFVNPPGAPAHLGDVIIAGPTARRQAQGAGHPLAEEASHLLVHGLLHLLGYDHLSREDERRMRAREDELLGRRVHGGPGRRGVSRSG